jgi:hypothetical protein
MTDPVQATPFTQEPAPVAEPVTPAVVQDPVQAAPAFQIPEAVRGLVGEGMKYATPEDALQSIPHAQHHIETLQEEMAGLREDLAKRKSVDEVLQEINKTPTNSETEPQHTPEELDALIDTRLTAKEAQTLAKSNTDKVVTKLSEVYGDSDKANEVYKQKAQDLGLSVDYLNNLTATSPSAVFELFGIKSVNESSVSKINSNINSEAVFNQAPVKEPVKSVMGGSTNAQDIAAWKAAAPTE